MENRLDSNKITKTARSHNFTFGSANNLEQEFKFGAAVPYGATFLLVGGDAIHKYIPSNDEWELMPERLSTARETRAAMVVRLDMFPSCTGDADEIGQGAIGAKTKRGKKYNPDLDPTQSNAHASNMDATESNVH